MGGLDFEDTFAVAGQLVATLLRFWPHAPHASSPSLLLCGPSGNGKTHLLRSTVRAELARRAQQRQQQEKTSTASGEGEYVVHKEGAALVVGAPSSLADVLTVRQRDGSTALRRRLREAVVAAVNAVAMRAKMAATMQTTTSGSNTVGETRRQLFDVLVVLDHLEFFAMADGEVGASTNGSGDADEDGGGAVSTRHPAFIADLYTVLRSAPPLFTEQETASLGLERIVFVSVFSGELDTLHPFLRDCAFDHSVTLPTPGQAAREVFFRQQIASAGSGISRLPSESLAMALALRTGGISYRGLTEIVDLLHNTVDADRSDDERPLTLASTAEERGSLDDKGANNASELIAASRAHELVRRFQFSGSMAALEHRSNAGYVDVQLTRWRDIAGMEETKQLLQDMVTRPLRRRDVYKAAGVRPSTGILLYGPPGTGKTMLAKAIATELNASFIYLDLPTLVQCEVGESERKLKNFFAVAKERSPTVMFMDELQAAFGRRYEDAHTRSGSGASISAHDARLVSHLLQLLDDAQADEAHVIIFIGATNVVSLLDPLLLRAGRLDTHIAVGLPEPHARRSLAQRVVLGDWATWWEGSGANQNDLAALQEALVDAFVAHSDGFSGADLRNATSVFALKLMQLVGQGAAAAAAAPAMLAGEGEVELEADGLVAAWSTRIVHLLWAAGRGEVGTGGQLTAVAKELVETAFVNGNAAVVA